jgi:hypothetical protein
MIFSSRLNPRLEDSHLGKHGAIGKALFDDILSKPPSVFAGHLLSFRNAST